ncbi:MAG: cyclic nucleotide-binding domain-containing protein [Hyphomicrobiales bacterium]
MLIDQGDLLWGMDRLFVKDFMAVSAKVQFETDSLIFREGDKADYFYTLVEGSVRLTTGQPPKEIYIIDKAGESFGWSSLVDRNYYSATAQCLHSAHLLQFGKKELSEFLLKNVDSALIFYKRLSGMLGNRLIQCYRLI